ncbi:OmpH family outer membrane protein [Aestuariibius sp. 2305UL40-4]|uniref:OmpH family outer membrane protein n=1 Tax=Aestuariibius violaceus TaxID=3234132 RepID=UPI00345EE308
MRVLALILCLLAGAGSAQDTAQSPVLVFDFDRMLFDSAFGQRVAGELRAAGDALVAENEAAEEALLAEEEALSRRRDEISAEEFAALASDFDARVQQIRLEQDVKEAQLEQMLREWRQLFQRAANPVLSAILEERGAAILLEQRSTYLAANTVDITDEAIARIDAEIGGGEALLNVGVMLDQRFADWQAGRRPAPDEGAEATDEGPVPAPAE